ncbi:MAG: PD-(D/E)XK nuclease family protein [Christensenellales bacterium]|jgi:ATP-dependent helicase/nuclease subunit B
MFTIYAGRTRRTWQPLIRQLKSAYDAGAEIVLLVPEHYTLQAERDIVADLNITGFFRIDVLSPKRLMQRIADRAGTSGQTPIDELGRNMAVMRALDSTKGELRYYYSAANLTGFANKLAAAITQIKEAGITPGALLDKARTLPESALQSKLLDTALVYRAYEELLSGQFADAEDQRSDLFRRMKAHHLFDGVHIFVYGFDLLTDALCHIITALSDQADSVYVSMVVEKTQAEDGEAFAGTLCSVQRLIARLQDMGTPYAFKWLPSDGFDAPAEILHLERYFLRPIRPVYHHPVDHLRLYAAPTPYTEVQYAAQQIVLAMLSGTPAGKIVVLYSDAGKYAGLIEAAFRIHDIPFYIAEKVPIAAHPLVKCLLSALKCLSDGWRQDDVMAFIKSGFSPLTEKEGWQLENYAIQFGINLNRWQKPFDRGTPEEAAQAELLRRRLVDPIDNMRKSLAAARTAGESLRIVLDFLNAIGAGERMLTLERNLVQAGMPEQAMRSRQVWRVISSVMEQMEALLGKARIPIRRFAPWLEAGLSASEISALPTEAESVHCGTIGHLIPKDPSMLILLGLNDGMLTGADEELFSVYETEEAERLLDLRMDMSQQVRSELSLLSLWKALSAPSDRLYLCYALANEEGDAMRPLPQLSGIRAMFPYLIEEGGALASESGAGVLEPVRPMPALDTIALLLKQGSLPERWADAWAWLCTSREWTQQARGILNTVGGEEPLFLIPAGHAKALYDTGTTSVSRLEAFAYCPFNHFVTYALKPGRRLTWEVAPQDAGIFIHDALEEFITVAGDWPAWPDVTQEECADAVENLLLPVMAQWTSTPFADSDRAAHRSRRMVDVCKQVAWTITSGTSHSAFKPVLAEARFGFGGRGALPPVRLPMSDGGEVLLHGVIDRIDRYEGEEGTFIRVVDYKSGSTSLRAERIWHGLQLQLLIYLKAALQASRGDQAAGAFYQYLDNPMAATEDASEAEKMITRALRLNGIALSDPEVCRLMDSSDTSINLPQYFKKDGTPKKNSPLLSRDEITLLTEYAVRAAADIINSMHAGNIARRPAVDRQGHSPCAWCEFAGICRRDVILGDRGARLISPMNMGQLISAARLSSITGAVP